MTKTQEREPPIWDDVAQEVDEMTDGLLRPVDEGIKSIVTALRVLGFGTVDSCEGHGRAGTAPYVTITMPVAPPVPKALWNELGRQNAIVRESLEVLLQKFYAGRSAPTPAARLTTKPVNPYGVWNLRPTGLIGGKGEGTRLHQLLQFRAELDAFAEFLRDQHNRADQTSPRGEIAP